VAAGGVGSGMGGPTGGPGGFGGPGGPGGPGGEGPPLHWKFVHCDPSGQLVSSAQQ